VKIEPSLPEAWLARVLQAGVSPSEFAEFALLQMDLDAVLSAYRTGAKVSPGARAARSEGEPPPGPGSLDWSAVSFNEFMDVLARTREFRYPLSLLAAYVQLGESPSSDQLQEACGFPLNDAAWEQVWHQELRAAKARLTIQAQRKSLPRFFVQPSTTSARERLHPIDPTILSWLSDWSRRNPKALPDPKDWGPQIGASPKYAGTLLKSQ
jgi:hypothetical protein